MKAKQHVVCLQLLFGVVCLVGCKKEEVLSQPFLDTFDGPSLAKHYFNTGGPYVIKDGSLFVESAFNHPLWLRKRLPENAEIEFDATPLHPEGDVKVEAWGDGESHATDKGGYLATSYVFIHGGWSNRLSALCRLDEHGSDRKVRKKPKVEQNKTYHWKIHRQGKSIRWFLDGELFLEMNDESPLTGRRHGYFGFNNWKVPVKFDNLKITPI